MASREIENLSRDLFILEDEDNPRGGKETGVWGSTTLDQVFDQLSPTRKTLRQILEDVNNDIITGGRGNIKFPVTSVNGKEGDIIIKKSDIDLSMVDNTSDLDKPLSTPQREAIMSILNEYDFRVNMDDFIQHITDTSTNPHGVTLDMLDKDEALTKFVNTLIGLHNFSTEDNIHTDIRRSLMKLWSRVDIIDNTLEDRLASALDRLDEHLTDINAHQTLLGLRESIENKVSSFGPVNNNSYDLYPSTRAVVAFVDEKLKEFNNQLPDIQNWVDDIICIDNRDQLPSASLKYYHRAYFIRTGIGSQTEVALCLKNPDNTYSWDISSIGSYSKFNPNEFVDTADGLSLKMSAIVDGILSENGALDGSLSKTLSNYYNKNDIDNMHLVNNINIVPGTINGTIRYYINDNLATMSKDVRVSGLGRLAFLENITEKELSDKAVLGRHIMDTVIENRHIKDRAITPKKINCKWGYVLGNSVNSTNNESHEIKLSELADMLRPLIGGWPDPNTPGDNPWNHIVEDYIMHPHTMAEGIEYDLKDGSFARRFSGKISVIRNMDYTRILTSDLNTTNIQLVNAGGTWMYQTNPEEWTLLGGSNITGHTFAMITVKKDGVFLESISIGDRMDAPFDIWIQYTKKK